MGDSRIRRVVWWVEVRKPVLECLKAMIENVERENMPNMEVEVFRWLDTRNGAAGDWLQGD